MDLNKIQIKHYYGTQIKEIINELAQLRIKVFAEWPYLYHGDLNYELQYLQVYLKSPQSLVLLVTDNDIPIGASTALPLAHESEEFQKPFLKAGLPIQDIFYFGESILLPSYRSHGVGKKFFELRESHAQKTLPSLRATCFCAVERPIDHPLKPPHPPSLAPFWEKMGYQKQKHLLCQYSWKDLGDKNESMKNLRFWIKNYNIN